MLYYRTKLVMLSQVYPDYIDAAFTGVRAENETVFKEFTRRYLQRRIGTFIGNKGRLFRRTSIHSRHLFKWGAYAPHGLR